MIKESDLYLLHKNDKGEWGMWREYYKKGTAIYWHAASEEQLYYLENTNTTKRKLQKYIEEQKKLFKSITPYSNGSGSDFNWVTQKQFERMVKKYEKEKRKRDRTK